ncbi:MAG: molybdate ABC transporter permease subunit [Chloroflexi bacterium]|nr:molybdate ABC transporter permease subunit [Chloroflexota bacterium]MCH2308151.1 molybdate ABC transporter permease subunit [SAR202 cluster bacterium]MQG05859.1 molybdate ABC transporter permease subunit [SAR202 cluster bacterium]
MYEHHFSALQLSLLVASSATILNVIPAIISALIITKTKLPGKIILDIIISLPLAIPPVAIGFFLLQILGNKSPLSDFLKITLGIDIIFTWQAAAIAAAITSFPLMVRTIIVSMNSIEEKLESCARTLGANKIKVMLTITIPLAYKGILGGILIGFIRSIGEFGATIIVAGNIVGKTQTIPLAIYSNIQIGQYTDVHMLILISLAITISSLIAYNLLLRNSLK